MSVSLVKGGNVSLTKEDPSIESITVGLGWDARSTDGNDFDLDASCFLLSERNKVRSDSDFIFYNNLKSNCGSVIHMGDNRTGGDEGDDEEISIDLKKIPNEVEKVAFAASIYDADSRNQNFGMVSNAYIRVVNRDTGREVARFDLSENASVSTAMIFGEVYRSNGEWKFRAVGHGSNGGLYQIAKDYGVNV